MQAQDNLDLRRELYRSQKVQAAIQEFNAKEFRKNAEGNVTSTEHFRVFFNIALILRPT